MTRGLLVARAAAALVGVPFRLHGRDPATGLDCIGLVALALDAAGARVSVPDGYRLRNRDVGPLLRLPEVAGLRLARGASIPGDILLTAPGAWQHHLLIAAEQGGFIHAHAGLRRVVAAPVWPGGPVTGHWRLQEER